MADNPQYETDEPNETNEIVYLEHQIVIQAGLNANGNRGVSCSFIDMTKEVDDEGRHSIIPYFEGRKLLALAEDNFLITYGMLQPPHFDTTDNI